MRLYFKNRNSPKAYKVVITALNNSQLGFIGEITNPTMKIGNGVVQFYLAPIASKGTWNISEDYHFKDGVFTVMAYKDLTYTSYNSHVNYSDFTKHIQLALALTEFHGFEIIGEVVKKITGLPDASWMYDDENKKILYYNVSTSGSLTLLSVSSEINDSLLSPNPTTKNNAELFVKEILKDLYRTQPKGLISPTNFTQDFIDNAVLTVLEEKKYTDTTVISKTTSSLNFNKGLVDRLPSTTWNIEGFSSVVEGGVAFSNSVLSTTGVLGDALKTSSKLLTGGQTPFEVSFEVMIKENQVKANEWPYLSLFSKSTNVSWGDQTLYIRGDFGYKLCFQRAQGVGGNIISEVVGKTRIEFNTKYKIKFLYDGNMFKCYVNDNLDFQFGTTVGWFVGSDQPYRLLDNFVPSFPLIGNRGFTNGFIDNIQVNDNYYVDPTAKIDPYKDSLISKLSFQGQADKTTFVDEARNVTWTGYGDAKLEVENTRTNYSFLKLNGLASYLTTENADYFAFTGNKFSIRMVFKTSTNSREQALFDRYESGKKGSYNISLSAEGKIVFYYIPTTSYSTFVSNVGNLNDGIKHSVDVIKDGTNILIYVDDLLDSIHDATGITFDYLISKTSIGAQVQSRNEAYDFNGQIYSLTVYKDEAVYPEIVPKVLNISELDFNRANLEDKYNNVVWNNNGGGVTFSRTESTNGMSAVFPSSSNIRSGPSSLTNFENKNFLIDIDTKNTSYNSASVLLMGGSSPAYQEISFGRTHGQLGIWCNDSTILAQTGLGTSNFNALLNVNYNIKTLRSNNNINIVVNDVLLAQRPLTANAVYDFNNSISTTIGGPYNSNSSFNYIGSMDNIKFVKDYQDSFVVKKPAISLPLETDSTNTGFTDLTINSVGDPTYTVIDGNKCIKFEPNKCLKINANNIFKLDNSTNFFISFDFNLFEFAQTNYQNILFSSGIYYSDEFWIWVSTSGHLSFRHKVSGVDGNITLPNFIVNLNTWYTVTLSRDGNVTTLTSKIKGTENLFTVSTSTVFSYTFDNLTTLGATSDSINNHSAKCYMSNFKMFVGTSEIPETYDDRKVLDVDFSPVWKKDGTRTSYLFEDKNKNCVIHPNGFYYRNYENGKYGATFNGSDQYIQLGKNNLLNLGKENFVIKIRFSVTDFVNTWQRLISDNQYSGGSRNYMMITGDAYSIEDKRHKVFFGLDDSSTSYMFGNTTILPNTEYVVEIVRDGNNFTMYLNDEIDGEMTSTLECNFNLNGNTFIGGANQTETSNESRLKQLFKGTINSVQIVRNTSDRTLLNVVEKIPESPEDTGEEGPPPIERGILRFWQKRLEVDPRNLVLEFAQKRLT